jgi:hypothetical protein
MTSEDEIILEYILTRESQSPVREVEEEEDDTESGRALLEQQESEPSDVFFIEEQNVTLKAGVFNQPSAEDEIGSMQDLPIKQSGTLVDFVLIAEDSNFSVKVEIDEHDIIDDTYSYISDMSTELSRIGGYEDNNGNYVVHVADYDFRERLNVLIRPEDDNTTFKLIRLEAEQ